MSGNNKNITMLANLGCNVQVTDANKYTALHWAAGILPHITLQIFKNFLYYYT